MTQNDHLAGRRAWQTFPIDEMFPMKILFLHGWQSVPGGVKPTYLKDHGHEVINPSCPTTISTRPSASPRPSSTSTSPMSSSDRAEAGPWR